MATKLPPAERAARQKLATQAWTEANYLQVLEGSRLRNQAYRERNKEAINARLKAKRAAKGR